MGTLREELSAAIESSESAAPEVDQAAPEVSEPVAEPVAADSPNEHGEEQERTTGARTRDEKGKFAAGQKRIDSLTALPQEAKPPIVRAKQDPASAAAQAAELRAPQSWKANIRERWSAIPPDAQQEIVRREREVSVALQQGAEARRQFDTVQKIIAPYEGMIRAEGAEPIAAIGSLLQTAAALRTAPPAHKARIVAELISSYGIDHSMLADALTGKASPAQEQQAFADPRVDKLLARMEQAEQQRNQARFANSQKAVSDFAKTHEFLDDVREDMAQFIEVAKARGLTLSLEDAYTRAVNLRPEIREVIEQRSKVKAAATAQAATQRSRLAASSVRSEPAKPGSGADRAMSRRDQIAAAISDLSGR